MPRAPFQILVFPFRPATNGDWEYAVFRLADAGWWQGVSGGGEADETPFQAARRECAEEAGIGANSRFVPLDTIASIRVTWFSGHEYWSKSHPYVIPEHAFGVECMPGAEFVISDEHDAYRWLPYAEAESLLRFDSNRTALWELDHRVRGLRAGES